MNREDIIRMAREAGFHAWYTQPEEHPDHVAIIERFAALVAAAERQRVRASMRRAFGRMAAFVRADEREVCAKVCDDLWQEDGTAYDCREAIRARSNT